ncbi:MAG: hypothetical protein COA97_04270 [Flavobacteriales bacterium]|nr:MAG: hypothetical protein COA97_04270 [Flavobacteriales bacterium]
MKKLFTFFFLVISLNSFSQFFPGYTPMPPADSCNFENTCARLTIDTTNANNNWVIGSTNKSFFGQANSLPNAIMTDSLTPYSSNNWSYFDLGFNMTKDWWMTFNIYIKFDHKYETDTLIDGGYITVSYDSGQTWINVIDDTCDFCDIFGGIWPNINSENLYTDNDTLANGKFGFSGTSDWKTTSIQLMYALPVKQIPIDTFIIRFNFISDSIQTNKDGWIIDNIYMGSVDVGSSVEEFPSTIQVKLFPNLTTDYFNYTVKNNESLKSIIITTITGAHVLSISNPKPEDRIDVSNLPSGNYFVKFIAGGSQTIKRLVVN